MTPRTAYRLFRKFQADHKDPMTQATGAGEFVATFHEQSARKLGMCMEDIADLAMTYVMERTAQRNRFKDPARLEWRSREGHRRMMVHEMA